jgi:hypothetical protein
MNSVLTMEHGQKLSDMKKLSRLRNFPVMGSPPNYCSISRLKFDMGTLTMGDLYQNLLLSCCIFAHERATSENQVFGKKEIHFRYARVTMKANYERFLTDSNTVAASTVNHFKPTMRQTGYTRR